MKTNKNAYFAPITTVVVLESADIMGLGLALSPEGEPGAAPTRYHSNHTNIAL